MSTRMVLAAPEQTQFLRFPLLRSGLEVTTVPVPLRDLAWLSVGAVVLLDLVGVGVHDCIASLSTLSRASVDTCVVVRVERENLLVRRLLPALRACYAITDTTLRPEQLALIVRYPGRADDTPLLLGDLRLPADPIVRAPHLLQLLQHCLSAPTFDIAADTYGLSRPGFFKIVRSLRVLTHIPPVCRFATPPDLAHAIIAALALPAGAAIGHQYDHITQHGSTTRSKR